MRRWIIPVVLSVLILLSFFYGLYQWRRGAPVLTMPVPAVFRDTALQVTLPTTETASVVSICSQHAPKCTLTEENWPEDTDAWQFTGKKWLWDPRTPNRFNREVVWEWSAPYAGDNPDYAAHREDHYSDYTNTPDGYPNVPGEPPKTYDWERWVIDEQGNYKLLQFGNHDEDASYLVGQTSCEDGLYYPVLEYTHPYAYTPMYTTGFGECLGNGYISAHLAEKWGEPLSATRLQKCDDPIKGVPSSLSPRGNAVCKLSPYTGVIYQRYIFGAGDDPLLTPGAGCEAVLYAWGWPEPQSAVTGQNYETWFRNGELHFSRWYDLSRDVASSGLPAPDDHEWWNSRCVNAWTDVGNWVYSGVFRIGETVYEDSAVVPEMSITQLPAAGGTMRSRNGQAAFTFGATSFDKAVTVTQFEPYPGSPPPPPNLIDPAYVYGLTAVYADSGEAAQPAGDFWMTITYADTAPGIDSEDKLGLFYWDGKQWMEEPAVVDPEANTIIAAPAHLATWWSVQSKVALYRIYFPALRLVFR